MKNQKYPKLLLEVEKELEADWLYHDWPKEAVKVISGLAKKLRKTIDELEKIKNDT